MPAFSHHLTLMCVFMASDGGNLLFLFTAIYLTGMTFDFKALKCETVFPVVDM